MMRQLKFCKKKESARCPKSLVPLTEKIYR
jgi:hypothetical protein